jgi:hypothetical protein
VSSNPAHAEVYSMQLYVIEFVSDLNKELREDTKNPLRSHMPERERERERERWALVLMNYNVHSLFRYCYFNKKYI